MFTTNFTSLFISVALAIISKNMAVAKVKDPVALIDFVSEHHFYGDGTRITDDRTIHYLYMTIICIAYETIW